MSVNKRAFFLSEKVIRGVLAYWVIGFTVEAYKRFQNK